ncbi:MAG: methyltransferase domain-containing protein [Candidatus Omnitrophica bacterium]|nr:methyltransferase domain-containing protein [Candidatus Omnitrophota bacterium]
MIFGIRRNDLVLEVGSGDFPNRFSDVLVDKHPFRNFQRNKDISLDRRLFIAADAQRLPFKDRAFDFVIASNILPYIDDPQVFFNELTRVAPRGVIVSISELFEQIRDIEFHKWYVNIAGGKIILKRKNKPDPRFGKFFHLLCEEDKCFKKFLNKHWYLFNLVYLWEGKINYQVVPDEQRVVDWSDPDKVRQMTKDTRPSLMRFLDYLFPQQFKNFVAARFIMMKKKRIRPELSDILVCPVCRGKVDISKDGVLCVKCKKTYRIKDGIPFMLDE